MDTLNATYDILQEQVLQARCEKVVSELIRQWVLEEENQRLLRIAIAQE